jgi:hypothetical protein
MAENMPAPACRNLDSLLEGCPRHKRAIVRLLWPKIRASLDRGHTAREIREKLRLDGIEVGYASLCHYIAQCRASDRESAARPTAAAGTAAGKPVPVAASEAKPRPDPLANVRRLTEERPPGFRYPGTLSDKELFGD